MKKTAKQAAPVANAPARYTLKTLDQVRVLAHPLRLRLLEAFAEAPRTTRQVAQAFDMPATRLYHHVNALESAGLIRLRETRPVRGTIEKYYEAVARRFGVASRLFSGPARGGRGRARAEIGAMAASVLEEARRDLTLAIGRATKTPESLRPLALRGLACGTPEQLAALRSNLLKAVQEYRKPNRPAGADGGELVSAHITIVFAIVGRAASKRRSPGRKPA